MHIRQRERLILRRSMQPQISLWTYRLRQHLLHRCRTIVVVLRWHVLLFDFAAEELPSIIFLNLLRLTCLLIARYVGLEQIDFTIS